MPILGPFSSALSSALSSVLFLHYIVFIKCLSRPVLLKCFTVGVILLFILVNSPSLPLSCLFIPNPPSPPLPSSPPSPLPLLSNQSNLTPSLGQSRCVETRGWGEEGDWRRRDHLWDLGLSSQPPPWCITRSFWDTLVTGLVLLNETSQHEQSQAPETKWLLSTPTY